MNTERLINPSPAQLREFLTRHLRARNGALIVVGQAEVAYQGRAASTADVGSYILIIKQDGSLQVQQATGVKPMNWQPQTDDIQVSLDGDTCMLLASRKSPLELVQVIFLEVSTALFEPLTPASGFLLMGSEAQMQERLANNPEVIEPGLTILDRELLVDSGGIDLYARDTLGRFVVVELKRGRATQDAVFQLARYVQSVRGVAPGEVRGILAAPGITRPALLELERRGLEFREVTALPAAPKAAAQPGLFD